MANAKIKEDVNGDPYIEVRKEEKWFTLPFDTEDDEVTRIIVNFDKEWESRVGQYLETQEERVLRKS